MSTSGISTNRYRSSLISGLFLFVVTTCPLTAAIDIVFDYSYDTGSYFTDDRKYVMDQVAYAFESRLASESFASLNPDDYSSDLTFYVNTYNPTTKASLAVYTDTATSEGNLMGAPNKVVILLGAKSVGTGTYLAQASSGYAYSGVANGTFLDYWDNTRNSTSNYDSVGGAITVNSSFTFYDDTDLTTHTDATSSGFTDFYSTMTHEVGHIMGFSNSWDAWQANKSGNLWTGSNGVAAYNGQSVPIDSASQSHFGTLTEGNVNCDCHPSMATSIPINTRYGFSELDFAMLKDIGYSVSASPTGTNIGGTYTDPDWGGTYYVPVEMTYANWLSPGGSGAAGPEPATVFPALAIISFVVLVMRNRRKPRLKPGAIENIS